jgi:hypothetical protein
MALNLAAMRDTLLPGLEKLCGKGNTMSATFFNYLSDETKARMLDEASKPSIVSTDFTAIEKRVMAHYQNKRVFVDNETYGDFSFPKASDEPNPAKESPFSKKIRSRQLEQIRKSHNALLGALPERTNLYDHVGELMADMERQLMEALFGGVVGPKPKPPAINPMFTAPADPFPHGTAERDTATAEAPADFCSFFDGTRVNAGGMCAEFGRSEEPKFNRRYVQSRLVE